MKNISVVFVVTMVTVVWGIKSIIKNAPLFATLPLIETLRRYALIPGKLEDVSDIVILISCTVKFDGRLTKSWQIPRLR